MRVQRYSHLSYDDVAPVMDEVARLCPHAFLRRDLIKGAMERLAEEKPANPVEFVIGLVNGPDKAPRAPMHRPRSAPTARLRTNSVVSHAESDNSMTSALQQQTAFTAVPESGGDGKHAHLPAHVDPPTAVNEAALHGYLGMGSSFTLCISDDNERARCARDIQARQRGLQARKRVDKIKAVNPPKEGDVDVSRLQSGHGYLGLGSSFAEFASDEMGKQGQSVCVAERAVTMRDFAYRT